MKPSKLPSMHGFIDNGLQLQREVAKSINRVQVYHQRSGVTPPAAAKLKAFLQAAIVEVDKFVVTPPPPAGL